jgi:hypothetical protein
MHFFAQSPLRSDAKAVTDDQHADQQLGIDRRSTGVAVVRREVAMQLAQIKESIDAPQKMILRNVSFKIEGIKQFVLTRTLPPHHLDVPPKTFRGQTSLR